MKILVTGGAGFIGSNLCSRLVYEGHKVICIDNLYTGSMRNIEKLLEFDNFMFINDNIMYSDMDYDADYIYHLACPASPRHYQRDCVFTMKTNILGALNVLEFARTKNARVLFSSTSEIYGDPLVHPQVEEYRGNVSCTGIRSCYDEGKRGAETLFMDYHRQYGVSCKIVRIFNTYGPGMSIDDGRAVSNFIVSAVKNEAIEVYGDGMQTRCFCYIDDMVDGLVRAMNDETHTGPVNLGNDNEIPVLELAKKIIRLSGSASNIVFKDLPEDDPAKRKPDLQKARSILGWEPKTLLDEGLNKTIAYFRSCLK